MSALYAYVTTAEGTILAVDIPAHGGWPLVFASREVAEGESIKNIARQISRRTNTPVQLVKYVSHEVLIEDLASTTPQGD